MRLPRGESAFKAIEAPAVVGELAFFDGGPRSATLEAVTDVEGARLDAGGAGAARRRRSPSWRGRCCSISARVLARPAARASDLIADLRE